MFVLILVLLVLGTFLTGRYVYQTIAKVREGTQLRRERESVLTEAIRHLALDREHDLGSR